MMDTKTARKLAHSLELIDEDFKEFKEKWIEHGFPDDDLCPIVWQLLNLSWDSGYSYAKDEEL